MVHNVNVVTLPATFPTLHHKYVEDQSVVDVIVVNASVMTIGLVNGVRIGANNHRLHALVRMG